MYPKTNQSNTVAGFGTEQMMIKENGEVLLHYTSGNYLKYVEATDLILLYNYYHRAETTIYLQCDPSVKEGPILAYRGEPAFFNYVCMLGSKLHTVKPVTKVTRGIKKSSSIRLP